MPAFAYLDHNASSPLRPAAFDAMIEALRAGGNPSSVHRSGRRARAAVEQARRQVAALVGALPAEVVFTSGGTEANNSALAGAGRKRVLVSAVEHDSVLRAAVGMEIVPVDGNGIVDPGVLEKGLAASAEPALVSVMFANNETGVLQPNRRAGTENVAGIAGFGVAATEASGGLATAEWRDRLEATLLDIAPVARVYGAGAGRLPNTTCVSMPGVRAETQVMALDLAGICVSAGAACSSGKVTRSAVLLAMGVEPAEAETALRISFGWSTISEDIERLIAAWRDLYIRVTHSDLPHARAA
ncbi:MAG: aminotransferase class V-fold PLP-dependent enzyme [Rhodospirillales bacterium]|nr:aminotransferase class V-fold PLP-dependent enzyme [Rhodospirillales bacterium]